MDNHSAMPLPTMMPSASLQSLNTLAVPATAAFLARVSSVEQLRAVLAWRKQEAGQGDQLLPIMALGGGSNVVLAADFPGLVLQIDIQGRDIIAEDDDYVWLKVGAGENWHQLVEFCMNFHYWGLENLALIPGSVGAAPIQNIGAYGVELCDYFAELSAVEIKSGLSVTFDKTACRFGYRDSIFKQQMKDRYIITSVTFKLRKEPAVVCEYPALKQFFEQQSEEGLEYGVEPPSPHRVFDAVCSIRQSKLPDPEVIPNVGSFFKNPVVTQEQYQNLSQQHEGLVGYPVEDGKIKLAAGWLIDQAGWRGYQQNSVGVHKDQALVLVNPGHGAGAEILLLAEKIQDDIKAKFGVLLEVEPRIYQ